MVSNPFRLPQLRPMARSRRVARLVSLFVLAAGALILSGCPAGPEKTPATLTAPERDAQLVAIASSFAVSSDRAAADQALSALDLPNPSQSVLALAERYIAEGEDSEDTYHLVLLAQALGPISRMAEQYLAQASPAALPAAGQAQAQPAAPAEPTATPSATAVPPTDTPQPTPTASETPTAAPTATPTSAPSPRVVANSQANVRSGPGTAYPVIGALSGGDQADVVGRNAQDTWWQIALASGAEGWVNASLVTVQGPVDAVEIAQNIPQPPATPTPAPPRATNTPVPPPRPRVDFAIVKQRMLTIDENSGCIGNHNIFVKIIDIAGNPVSGVIVKRVWTGEEKASGSKESDYQGRPDAGWLQFDLYKHGDQVVVVRDADGREVSSDVSRSLEVEDEKIGAQLLMETGYCASLEECQQRIDTNSLCRFHYSWEVVFQRQY